ncbi:hypothetical protein E5288_WYG003271 [Bos mutus]|uniref:Uncharacterized protein n=1 Tax=Bos mutus TaxID=72004 RepID=A0A6B0S6M6_9CETA|nr:hypothetical protein [Bos mutus]
MGQLGVQGNGGQSGARAEVLHGPPGCPVFSDDVTQLQMQLGIDPFSTVSSQERLFPANTELSSVGTPHDSPKGPG